MMLTIFLAIVQAVAGVWLGLIGLVLCGDFTYWWKFHGHKGNPRLAGAVMFALYLAALAVIRFVR